MVVSTARISKTTRQITYKNVAKYEVALDR